MQPTSIHSSRGPRAWLQIRTILDEDIARLTDVLRSQQCSVALRGIDGVALAIDTLANDAPTLRSLCMA